MTLAEAGMAFQSFVNTNWHVLLFYIVVIAIIYMNKKKFDVQLGFIALFRTKWGLKAMDKWAKRHPRFFRFIGDLGIVVGFTGMVLMFFVLLQGVLKFFMNPKADAVVAVVIPGLQIGNSPLNGMSLAMGLLIIFLVASFHEFGHGVISRLYNIKVKSSGIVFFGPILGAFVEPDQKDLDKVSDNAKLAMFAAGPFFNVIMTIGAVFLLWGMGFAGLNWYDHQPAVVGNVVADSTLEVAGIEKGSTILNLNGIEIESYTDLVSVVNEIEVNDSVSITTESGTVDTVMQGRAEDASIPFLGIEFTQTTTAAIVLHKMFSFLYYLAMISLGIGTANLLPFGPLDGGRMIHNRLNHWFGKRNEKAAMKAFSVISGICLLMLLISILGPIFGVFI